MSLNRFCQPIHPQYKHHIHYKDLADELNKLCKVKGNLTHGLYLDDIYPYILSLFPVFFICVN